MKKTHLNNERTHSLLMIRTTIRARTNTGDGNNAAVVFPARPVTAILVQPLVVMAVPLSQRPRICQGFFCHSCTSASVKGCHHSRGASSKGCCYMARCPEPVRPPGFAHHLSLSALSPGSFGQLMVHWVSPNSPLTNRSAAG